MPIIQVNGRYTTNGSSPYGPTADITRLHQQNLNAEIAIGANPWLANDLPSLMRITQSGADPLAIADNAAALAGMETLDSMAAALNSLTPVAQRAAYNRLTEQQQRGLAHMGFQPKQENRGFLDGTPLEGAWDLAADVTGVVTQPIKTVVAPLASYALDLLTWVGDVPAHFYRAIRQMEGWQQWLALAGAAAAVGAAGFLTGGAAFTALPGTLGALGSIGGIGLAGATLATAPTAITNPTEWWDMMNPFGATGVGRGERIFLKGARNRARDILGGAEHLDALARDIAAELDVYEIAEDFAGVREANKHQVLIGSIERVASKMADPGTEEFKRVYQALTTLVEQPEFKQAVDELQNGKISFGRDIAGLAQRQPGDFGYGLISGAADAMWLLTMDPTMALGKMGQAQKLFRRGIEAPTGPAAVKRLNQMVNEDPAVGAVANQVAKAVNGERLSQMPKAWRSLYQPMVEFKRGMIEQGHKGPFDVETFMKYIEEGDGLTRIMEGKGTVRGIEHIVISAQSKDRGWGKFVDSVRQFQRGLTDEILIDDLYRTAKNYGVEADLDKMLVRNYLDEAVDMRFEYRPLDGPPISETAGYAAGSAIGKGLLYVPGGRTLGNFIGGITTMIPAGSALKLTPGSADDVRDMVEDIPRFVEAMGRHMNMPSAMRDEWLDVIIRQENVAMRRNAMVSFMDSIFTATGFRATDEFAQVADEFLFKYKQAYALGGLDDTGQFIRGVLPDLHQAVYMVMPDLRAMSKIVRQGHILKHVAKLTDSSFAEQAMSRVIKPGWLLRIGFIPRAAGEEMLAFWLRMSEGGIAQEFAARTIAKRRAAQSAMDHLRAVDGDIWELTAAQRKALNYRLPSHLKPLAWMGNREGWRTADQGILDRWVDWTTGARETGLGIQVPELPKWADQIALGKDRSIRRAILSGVDPELQEAAYFWMHQHSSQVLRATSTLNSSDIEKAVANPDTTTVMLDDPNHPGHRKEVEVILNGERGRVGVNHPFFAAGVHHRAGEVFHDGVVAPFFMKNATEFLPEQVLAQLPGGRMNIAEMLENLVVADTWSSKMLVSELLQPRQDNFRAAAAAFRKHQPEVADVLESLARKNQLDVGSMINELKTARVAAAASGNGEAAMKIMRLEERLETMKPVLEGFDAIDPNAQAWLAALASRYMADPESLNVPRIRAWAEGQFDAVKWRPKNVYYRGVQDTQTIEIRANPNGGHDLVLKPQKQGQWDGYGAVSMSVDPLQSARYATSRGSTYNGVMGTGAMIEVDADYMNSLYNKTMDQIRANPVTYNFTHADAPGPYLIGRENDVDFTEIAFVTDADEIVIPAGHWQIQDTDSFRELVTEGVTKDPYGKFSAPEYLDADVWEIEGVPLDQIAPAWDRSVQDVVDSFTDREIEHLRARFNGNLNELDTWNMYRYSPDDWDQLPEGFTADKPEFVISEDLMKNGLRPTGEDEVLDGIIEKLNRWRDAEVIPGSGITNMDVVTHYGTKNTSVHQTFAEFDDVWRERLGLGGLAEIKLSGYVRPIDPLQGRSRMNAIMQQAWELRGQGGWADIDLDAAAWSPFTQSFDEFRERMINDIVMALHRPEHADQVKLAEQVLATKDGTPVARPPTDGLTRIYEPVVPINSSQIDELLDSNMGDVGDAANAFLRRIEHQLVNWENMDIHEQAGFISQLEWAMQGAADPQLADDMAAVLDQAGRDMNLVEQRLVEIERDSDLEILPFDDPWDTDIKYRQLMENMEQNLVSGLRRLQNKWKSNGSYEDAAITLMSRGRGHYFHDPVLDALTEEERVAIVAKALATYDASRAKYAMGTSQPLHGLAFDDPRIAKWISSMLADGPDEAQRVAQIEVTRRALSSSGAKIDGVRLNSTNETVGRSWEVDDRYVSQAVALDTPGFHRVPYEYTAPNGEVLKGHDVVVGKSIEEAYAEWAEDIVDTVLQNTRRGVREQQVFKGQRQPGRTVARRQGDMYQALEDGEIVGGPEDLYFVNKNGKVTDPVQVGDNRFFDHVVTDQQEDLMWHLVGPMLRDSYEEQGLLAKQVAKDFRQRKGVFGQTREVPIDTDLEADRAVRMTRSRVDDVAKEPADHLPNVAIVQDFDYRPNTLWDRIVRFGFDKIIGPAIDSLARHPMSFHYFAQAYKQNKRNLSWMLNHDLFEIEVANEFAPAIDMLLSEAAVPEERLADMALVARQGFNVSLDPADPDGIKQWLVAMSNDNDDWLKQLEQVQIDFRKRSMASSAEKSPYQDEESLVEWVSANTELEPEWQVVEAAERLKDVNRNAISMTLVKEGLGAGTPAQQLVMAYHQAVPDSVWEEGADAVRGFLNENKVGLPSKLTAEQWRVLKTARTNLDYALRTARETATFRAMENVIPFLDSHEQRSMLAEYGRNFVPFWYAEENFIKRWARTLSLGSFATPLGPIPSGGLDAIRKAQLTYMGIKSAGIIRTDANGQDWVVYPGSNLLNEVVSKIMPGGMEPIGVTFAATTDSLLPGVTPEGHISPSPFVALPVHMVTHLFPDAQGVKTSLLGEIGSQRSIVSQFVPSIMQNTWEALFNDENSSVRYTSAMMAAMTYAEAEGRGLPANATADQIDEYLERMSNHARIIMTSQAITGYVVPGSPAAFIGDGSGTDMLLGTNLIDPEEVTTETYRDFIKNLGIEEGTAAFLRAFPDADLEDVINPLAFTASGTEVTSRAPLPATKLGIRWYEDNKDWVDSLPEAGAWLMPQDGKDNFEYTAYRQQLAHGLRKRRTPQEFVRSIKYRTAATTYFDYKDQYDEAVLAVGGDQNKKRALDAIWESWKTPFLAANPIFAEELQTGDSRIRRDRTVQQMRYAVQDPSAPDSPYKDAIAEMVRAYDQFNTAAKVLRQSNTADSKEKLRALKDAFASFGEGWVLRNRDLERLWTGVYRLEAGLD